MSNLENKTDLIRNYRSYIHSLNYKEPFPSMKEFLSDPQYLGNMTNKGAAVYPVWADTLEVVSKEDSKYIYVLTGAIGIGKTFCAVYGMLYTMCRILCIDGNCSVYDCEKKKWVKLSQAYNQGLKHTLAMDEEGNVQSFEVDQIIKSGKKPVYEIAVKYAEHTFKKKEAKETSDGRIKKIRTTLDHKFWTKEGWKCLRDIRPGEQVLIFGEQPLSKSERSKNVSDAVKKVWSSRTKEERYRICLPGIETMNSGDIKLKNKKIKQTKEFSEKIRKAQTEFWDSLIKEEKQERTKHLRNIKTLKKVKIGIKQNWDSLTPEERIEEVLRRLSSTDREAMRLAIIDSWTDERRKKQSELLKNQISSLSKEELQERIKKAVKGWKKYWNSLSQEEKNCIIEKQIETRKKLEITDPRAYWGWGKPSQALDGHICDSKFEKEIDDWLYKNGITHKIHTRVKNNGKIRSIDFEVNGFYIEVDGLNRSEDYFKERLNNLPYIVIRFGDNIEEKLDFLRKNTNHNFEKSCFGKVLSVEYKGEKQTYDVVMAEGSPKNFICGGFVVHNCLKNPWEHFGCAPGSQMSVVFFNLTKSQSESTAYKLFQNCLVGSPWFRERGIFGGTELNPKLEFPLFKYTFASPFVPGFGSQGEHVILALLDEVDSPIASEVQREKVVSAYENARRRLESRFVSHGETIGRFFMVASKQERLSFLNVFIAKYKNSKSVVIVDVPLWLAKPRTNFSSEEFAVSCGDVYNPPRILETKEDLESAMHSGYQIVKVPMDFYDVFLHDILGSLKDIGGISVSSIRATKLFSSESLLLQCFTEEKNPVKVMTVDIGLKDDIDLINFLDLTVITIPRNVARYIHQDFSFSGDGDATGIAMSCVKGWTKKNIENADGTFHVENVPLVGTDFAIRIKARSGDKIPLHKIRKFYLDLKKIHGFNIQECTFDLRIATESDKQILERAGISCDHISMDKDIQRYRDLRNLVVENRWSTPWHPYLHFELKNLEEDSVKNMIDHPAEVAVLEFLEDGNTREIVLLGSKDISDAVGGSVTRAIEKCVVPPDIEYMESLMKKCNVKPLTTDINSLRLAGVEVKKLEETGGKEISKIQTTQYNNLVKRVRGLHQK